MFFFVLKHRTNEHSIGEQINEECDLKYLAAEGEDIDMMKARE